jgi:hypothetical protein
MQKKSWPLLNQKQMRTCAAPAPCAALEAALGLVLLSRFLPEAANLWFRKQRIKPTVSALSANVQPAAPALPVRQAVMIMKLPAYYQIHPFLSCIL